jgi:16S rRNA (guanine966-N2)-methyltransferase
LAELADPLIVDKAYIYVEADRELTLLQLPNSWKKIKETKAGVVRAGLYQKII